MFFPEQIQLAEEDVGELFIPVHRSGDVSQELMVVCSTQQGRDALRSHTQPSLPPPFPSDGSTTQGIYSPHLLSWKIFSFIFWLGENVLEGIKSIKLHLDLAEHQMAPHVAPSAFRRGPARPANARKGQLIG